MKPPRLGSRVVLRGMDRRDYFGFVRGINQLGDVRVVFEDDGANVDWLSYAGKSNNGEPRYAVERCRWFTLGAFAACAKVVA